MSASSLRPSPRSTLFAAAAFIGCLAGFVGLASPTLAAPMHPALHQAIFELQEARKELNSAPNIFGGHKEKALEAIAAAIGQIEKTLETLGDGYKGLKGHPPEVYKKYERFPHIQHAVVELRASRAALMNVKVDLGGQREKSIAAVSAAIEQLELAMKFAAKR